MASDPNRVKESKNPEASSEERLYHGEGEHPAWAHPLGPESARRGARPEDDRPRGRSGDAKRDESPREDESATPAGDIDAPAGRDTGPADDVTSSKPPYDAARPR